MKRILICVLCAALIFSLGAFGGYLIAQSLDEAPPNVLFADKLIPVPDAVFVMEYEVFASARELPKDRYESVYTAWEALSQSPLHENTFHFGTAEKLEEQQGNKGILFSYRDRYQYSFEALNPYFPFNNLFWEEMLYDAILLVPNNGGIYFYTSLDSKLSHKGFLQFTDTALYENFCQVFAACAETGR